MLDTAFSTDAVGGVRPLVLRLKASRQHESPGLDLLKSAYKTPCNDYTRLEIIRTGPEFVTEK